MSGSSDSRGELAVRGRIGRGDVLHRPSIRTRTASTARQEPADAVRRHDERGEVRDQQDRDDQQSAIPTGTNWQRPVQHLPAPDLLGSEGRY